MGRHYVDFIVEFWGEVNLSDDEPFEEVRIDLDVDAVGIVAIENEGTDDEKVFDSRIRGYETVKVILHRSREKSNDTTPGN